MVLSLGRWAPAEGFEDLLPADALDEPELPEAGVRPALDW
jgi:hypothetical protein